MYSSLFALAAIFASAVIADPSPPLPTGCVQNSKNCGVGKPLNNATIPIFKPGLRGPSGIPGPTAVPIPKGGGAGGGAGKDGGKDGGKNGDVILSTVTFTTCVPTVVVSVITVKPSPTKPATPKRPAQPSAGIPNKPAPPIFSGAASVARSSSPFVVIAGAVVFLL